MVQKGSNDEAILTSAVEKHQHWFVGLDRVGRGLGPNVQSQTVLTLRSTSIASKVGNDILRLGRHIRIVDLLARRQGAVIAKLLRLVGFPRGEALRGSKAQLAHGGLCVRDAQVLDHARRVVSEVTRDGTVGRVDGDEVGGVAHGGSSREAGP